MLNFDFLEKSLGIVSSPHFLYGFSRKNVSHAIFYKLTKFCYLIALRLEILESMCIAIVVNQIVMSKILKLSLSF